MKFIDLFAGVGGFRLAMERAGHECVWSCEIDRWCQAVYRHHWGQVKAGDARRVNPATIPDFDILCAGFPCQSFSVAGKRKGFQDTRGTLFYEISRIAEAKRPRLLLLENVRGLLSNDRGQTFLAVLRELGRIGYWAEWQVLNSKHITTPQNRPRVFVVGHRRGSGGREIFPITENDSASIEATEGQEGKVTHTLTGENAGGGNARGNYIAEGAPMIYDDYNSTLKATGIVGAVRQTFSRQALGNACKLIRWQNKKDGVVVDDTAPTLRSSGGTDIRKRPAIISATNPHSLKESRTYHLSNETRALKCPSGNQESLIALIQSGLISLRRFTPHECERLQGFPDDWTRWGIDEKGKLITISETRRYKMMGEAVTVPVVEFLAGRIK